MRWSARLGSCANEAAHYKKDDDENDDDKN